MKVERAARGLVDLLLSSLDTEIVLESTVVSGRATPATTITITVPKKADLAEMDLKPGTCIHACTCTCTLYVYIYMYMAVGIVHLLAMLVCDPMHSTYQLH